MSESVPPISEIAEELAWRAHDARELGHVAAQELAACSAAEGSAEWEVLHTEYMDLVEEFNQTSTMAACIFGPEWGRYRELSLGPNHLPNYEEYGGAYGVSDRLAVQLNMPMVELVAIYNQDANPLALAQIQHGLARQGLHTLADVLMLGVEASAGSLPNFRVIHRTVERIDPEFNWPRRASIAYIAKICRTPLEVPGSVLGKVCGKLDIEELTGLRTLQDILNLPEESLMQFVAGCNPDAPVAMVEKSALTLQKKANAFARDFLDERRRLLRKLAQG